MKINERRLVDRGNYWKNRYRERVSMVNCLTCEERNKFFEYYTGGGGIKK